MVRMQSNKNIKIIDLPGRTKRRRSCRILKYIILAPLILWVPISLVLNHHLLKTLLLQSTAKKDDHLTPSVSSHGTTAGISSLSYGDEDGDQSVLNEDEIYARPKIGYAISFIDCPSKEDEQKLLDSIRVLRHSIHNISSRNPSSNSKYDYKMYAIVRAKRCSSLIKSLAFDEILLLFLKTILRSSTKRSTF